jgi:hypothetical protein
LWRSPPACSGSPYPSGRTRGQPSFWPWREYLTGEWPLWKMLLALLVPASFAVLAVAFWKRSLVWGLAMINAMVLVKIVWSFYFGDASGGLTLLPSAMVGLAVCDAVILYFVRRTRKGSSPRQASQHGG